MKTMTVRNNRAGRLDTGAAILAAAQLVDVTLVKARLGTFADAQRCYAEAQQHVDAAGAALREGQIRLARRDAEQDEAVEGLARVLVNGGQPRTNPFAAFGTAAPSVVKHMSSEAKTQAVHQLVAAVQREKPIAKATLHAAQAADQSAERLTAALLAVEKLEQAVNNVRHARDGIEQTWQTALAALKRGARAAADDGAPGLYMALFGHTTRSHKKTAPPAPAPTPPALGGA